MINNRPEITEELISQIKAAIRENPEWGRSQLSRWLCEQWEWKNSNGLPKDISCRDMLRFLDRSERIHLPPQIHPARKVGGTAKIKHLSHNTSPVECALAELAPLSIDTVACGDALEEFKSLIDQHHYLGFGRTVGENIKYMVRSSGGTALACLLFGSAAWACGDRDAAIGWDATQRKRGLPYMTNNTRFLILPWVRVPHLASHVLGRVARRVSADWVSRYGHELYCLETFVERSRFVGTCYKAANWQCVGRTSGGGRNGKGKEAALPIKDVYIYPLAADFQQKLSNAKGE